MYRTALGYDLHRLKSQEKGYVICGGCKIECNLTVEAAHSDGDALYHALTDALLSVIGTDIGVIFPNTDPLHKNQDSTVFLTYAYEQIKSKYAVENIDAVIICDAPKISPHSLEIRENISRILNISIENISVRGKTTENTRLHTIEVYVSALFKKK